jgi:TonB family protein
MTTQALIYHRPSKWPIATAFAAAVLIHLSAVAIAFHREPLSTPLITTDFTPIEFEEIENLPTPPDPDIEVPSPPPPPSAEFIESPTARHPITNQQPPRPIWRPGQTRVPAVANAKAFAISAPRPDYPYEARSRHLTGTGVAGITVDSSSGLAIDAGMEQSIGNPILDNSAISAFRRWRFKPGTPPRVRIPITFMLTGAQY